MELGGAAQRLAGAHVSGGFSGVMHDEHGEAVLALQGAQVREERCDFAAGVLIDAMQPHEGIEHQQAGLELRDGFIEARAIGLLIEPYGGCGDHVNVEIFQITRRGGTDALESAAHDVQSVLGRIQQHAPRMRHREVAQTRCAGSDGNGQIQSEEGFSELRFPADDSDCLLGPQPGNEPALLLGTISETISQLDGERAHRRRPDPLGCVGEGVS